MFTATIEITFISVGKYIDQVVDYIPIVEDIADILYINLRDSIQIQLFADLFFICLFLLMLVNAYVIHN
jgi:hypothetical protein